MSYRGIVGTLLVLGSVSAASAQVAPGGRVFELSGVQDPIPSAPDLAMVDGRAVAVWHGDCIRDVGCHVFARLVGKKTGPPGVRLNDGLARLAATKLVKPAVVGMPDGRFVAFWRSAEGAIIGRRFDPVTGPIDAELVVATGMAMRGDPVATPTAGGMVVAWIDGSQYLFQRLTFDAVPVGDLGTFDAGDVPRALALAPLPDGGFAVAYPVETMQASWRIALRHFGADGEPEGDEVEVTPPSAAFKTDPSLAIGANGRGVVLWRESMSTGFHSVVRGRRQLRSGVPDGPIWDLAPSYVRGVAEVIVLPGDHFAMVYELQQNPTQAPVAVLATFDGDGAPLGASRLLAASHEERTAIPALAGDGKGNAAAAWLNLDTVGDRGQVIGRGVGFERLALGAGARFHISATWQDFRGNTGSGVAAPVSTDTGGFWFFDPANIELNVKVLDGRGGNGHFWVFYGSLSNVAFTLTVTDTETGAVRVYDNPLGVFASRGDTMAFPEDL